MDKKITKQGIKNELARRFLLNFITQTMPNYKVNWHHKFIADKLTDFAEGKIKNLMLSVPPQHGKTEIASRRLPAYILGKNPNKRIAGCSYNETFASKINRQVQRIITSQEYAQIFPKTTLNNKNIATDSKGNYLRNSKEFEIVEHQGSYMSVGVGGGITGNPVDIGIIDDPIKGREEANSVRYREKLWEWYTDEFLTRLHNNSQQLIIMTRWHEDDLIGRILASDADNWTVINIPAIKENNENDFDKRGIGDVLWSEVHSLEKILKIKSISPTTFQSLYQGNPTTPGGNKIKEHYFEIVENAYLRNDLIFDVFIDGAYTKDTSNDPTGILICAYDKRKNELIIKNSIDKYLEMPELLTYLDTYLRENGISSRSRIFVEPKASGITLKQYLVKRKYNAQEIKNKYVGVSKIERVETILPILETSGRVKLIKGVWNSKFLSQVKAFPNDAHDEHVDLLCYSVINYFLMKHKIKSYNNLAI